MPQGRATVAVSRLMWNFVMTPSPAVRISRRVPKVDRGNRERLCGLLGEGEGLYRLRGRG